MASLKPSEVWQPEVEWDMLILDPDGEDSEEEVAVPVTTCYGRGKPRPKLSDLRLPRQAFNAAALDRQRVIQAKTKLGRGRARTLRDRARQRSRPGSTQGSTVTSQNDLDSMSVSSEGSNQQREREPLVMNIEPAEVKATNPGLTNHVDSAPVDDDRYAIELPENWRKNINDDDWSDCSYLTAVPKGGFFSRPFKGFSKAKCVKEPTKPNVNSLDDFPMLGGGSKIQNGDTYAWDSSNHINGNPENGKKVLGDMKTVLSGLFESSQDAVVYSDELDLTMVSKSHLLTDVRENEGKTASETENSKTLPSDSLLSGENVLVIENLPAGCCETTMRDFLSTFGQVLDMETRTESERSIVKVRMDSAETCNWTASCLNDVMDIVPGAEEPLKCYVSAGTAT